MLVATASNEVTLCMSVSTDTDRHAQWNSISRNKWNTLLYYWNESKTGEERGYAYRFASRYGNKAY